MIALVAMFALLVQALVPSLATAGPAGDPAMVICTAKGLQSAPADPGQPAADHACQHCLCPAPVLAADPAPAVEAVAYAVAEASSAAAPRTITPPARAPPRPPGQGPPRSDA